MLCTNLIILNCAIFLILLCKRKKKKKMTKNLAANQEKLQKTVGAFSNGRKTLVHTKQRSDPGTYRQIL